MALWRVRMSGRHGVSLIEMAIVLAIVGILAALGGSMLTDMLPTWRTRRAAHEFQAALNQCRQLAISQGVEYRVRMAEADADLDGSGPSVGRYFIERGNFGANSTVWDILPWDPDGTDATTGEGTIDLSEGALNALRGVSIAPWNTIAGVDGDDLVFSPRGWLVNPVSDFNALGYVEITFVNKRARSAGAVDEWTVMVSRGGLVRAESNRKVLVSGPGGTPSASSWSAGTGHDP